MKLLAALGLTLQLASGGADGGRTPDASVTPAKRALSTEDLEVMQNLELLESLDEAADLELLQELTVE